MGNKKYFLFLIAVVLLLTQNLLAEEVTPPKSLLEAIHVAILYNAKTRSKDVEAERYELQTKAVKAGRLPSASISCTHQSFQSEQGTQAPDPWQETRQKSNYCGLDLSVTVWDNGARTNAIKAAEMREKWIKSFNNSTNPLVLYTKGTIANATIQAYSNLIMNQEALEMYERDLEFYNLLMRVAKTEEDKNRIRTAQNQARVNVTSYLSSIEVAKSDFQYNTTVLPSENIDRYEATVQKLRVPENAEVAMQVALEKSPDIQARKYALEAAEYDYQSAKSALGPRVTLSIHRDTYRGWNPIEQNSVFYTNSHYIGLTLIVPLNIPSYYSLRAQAKAREQASLERDASLDDAQHSLNNIYGLLKSQYKLEKTYKANYEELKKIIDEIERKILANEPGLPDIKYILDQRSEMDGAYMGWQGNLSSIVSNMSSILQVTGTLFDETYAMPIHKIR